MDAAEWLTNLKHSVDGFVLFKVLSGCMTATFGFDIGLLAAEHLVVQNISSCDLRSACLPHPPPLPRPHIRLLGGPVRAMKTLTSHVLHIIISASPLPPSSMLNQLGVGSACDENAHFCKCCARPRPSTLNWGERGAATTTDTRSQMSVFIARTGKTFSLCGVCVVSKSHIRSTIICCFIRHGSAPGAR